MLTIYYFIYLFFIISLFFLIFFVLIKCFVLYMMNINTPFLKLFSDESSMAYKDPYFLFCVMLFQVFMIVVFDLFFGNLLSGNLIILKLYVFFLVFIFLFFIFIKHFSFVYYYYMNLFFFYHFCFMVALDMWFVNKVLKFYLFVFLVMMFFSIVYFVIFKFSNPFFIKGKNSSYGTHYLFTFKNSFNNFQVMIPINVSLIKDLLDESKFLDCDDFKNLGAINSSEMSNMTFFYKDYLNFYFILFLSCIILSSFFVLFFYNYCFFFMFYYSMFVFIFSLLFFVICLSLFSFIISYSSGFIFNKIVKPFDKKSLTKPFICFLFLNFMIVSFYSYLIYDYYSKISGMKESFIMATSTAWKLSVEEVMNNSVSMNTDGSYDSASKYMVLIGFGLDGVITVFFYNLSLSYKYYLDLFLVKNDMVFDTKLFLLIMMSVLLFCFMLLFYFGFLYILLSVCDFSYYNFCIFSFKFNVFWMFFFMFFYNFSCWLLFEILNWYQPGEEEENTSFKKFNDFFVKENWKNFYNYFSLLFFYFAYVFLMFFVNWMMLDYLWDLTPLENVDSDIVFFCQMTSLVFFGPLMIFYLISFFSYLFSLFMGFHISVVDLILNYPLLVFLNFFNYFYVMVITALGFFIIIESPYTGRFPVYHESNNFECVCDSKFGMVSFTYSDSDNDNLSDYCMLNCDELMIEGFDPSTSDPVLLLYHLFYFFVLYMFYFFFIIYNLMFFLFLFKTHKPDSFKFVNSVYSSDSSCLVLFIKEVNFVFNLKFDIKSLFFNINFNSKFSIDIVFISLFFFLIFIFLLFFFLIFITDFYLKFSYLLVFFFFNKLLHIIIINKNVLLIGLYGFFNYIRFFLMCKLGIFINFVYHSDKTFYSFMTSCFSWYTIKFYSPNPDAPYVLNIVYKYYCYTCLIFFESLFLMLGLWFEYKSLFVFTFTLVALLISLPVMVMMGLILESLKSYFNNYSDDNSEDESDADDSGYDGHYY